MENKTLLQQVENYIKANDTLKLPFYRIYDAVIATVSAVVIEGEKLNYSLIELLKVVNFTMNALAEIGIEYNIPKSESDELDHTEAYDELIDIYNYLQMHSLSFCKMEELLEKEIKLAEKQYLQVGVLESRLLSTAERFVDTLENISSVVNDKKKFSSLLKTVNKELPNLKEIIKVKE